MPTFTQDDRVRQGYAAGRGTGAAAWTYGREDYESDGQDMDIGECVEYARGLALDLGRKFVDADIGEFAELAPAAVRYLTETASTFGYSARTARGMGPFPVARRRAAHYRPVDPDSRAAPVAGDTHRVDPRWGC